MDSGVAVLVEPRYPLVRDGEPPCWFGLGCIAFLWTLLCHVAACAHHKDYTTRLAVVVLLAAAVKRSSSKLPTVFTGVVVIA